MLLFNKYDIKFNSFTKKGVPNIEDNWGVYMITGFQGSGKTYFAVQLVNDLINGDKSILSENIKIKNNLNKQIPNTKK